MKNTLPSPAQHNQRLLHHLALRDDYFFSHYLKHHLFRTKHQLIDTDKLIEAYRSHLYLAAASETTSNSFDLWLAEKTSHFSQTSLN
jgi:hypothetical protein